MSALRVGYVRAGGNRELAVCLPPQARRDLMSLTIGIELEPAAADRTVETPGGACGS